MKYGPLAAIALAATLLGSAQDKPPTPSPPTPAPPTPAPTHAPPPPPLERDKHSTPRSLDPLLTPTPTPLREIEKTPLPGMTPTIPLATPTPPAR